MKKDQKLLTLKFRRKEGPRIFTQDEIDFMRSLKIGRFYENQETICFSLDEWANVKRAILSGGDVCPSCSRILLSGEEVFYRKRYEPFISPSLPSCIYCMSDAAMKRRHSIFGKKHKYVPFGDQLKSRFLYGKSGNKGPGAVYFLHTRIKNVFKVGMTTRSVTGRVSDFKRRVDPSAFFAHGIICNDSLGLEKKLIAGLKEKSRHDLSYTLDLNGPASSEIVVINGSELSLIKSLLKFNGDKLAHVCNVDAANDALTNLIST